MLIEDLSPCSYVASSRSESEKLKAVGWLAWGHSYKLRNTKLPETRFLRLLRLLVNPWEPGHFMDYHECEFCFEETVPCTIQREGLVVYCGANNLYVPASGYIFVAPSLIAHYVEMHSYEPPEIFWEAVMNCPEMGSEAYKQALVINGPSNKRWRRDVRLAL